MEQLKDSERRTTSVQWPTAVDDRLDMLLRLLAVEGVPTSRAQLLAALVAAAPLDGPKLARTVNAYRKLLLDVFQEQAVSQPLPTVRRPGPRRRL